MTKDTKIAVITVILVSAFCGYIFVPMENKPGEATLKQWFDLNKGIDLDGGAEVVYRVDPGDKAADREKVQSVAEVIRKRIDKKGLKEPKINVSGDDKIQIQIAGIDQVTWQEYKGIIERLGKLELMEVADQETHKRYADAGWKISNPDYVVLPNPEKRGTPPAVTAYDNFVLKAAPIVTGEHVKDAYPNRIARPGQGITWEIAFKLDSRGGKLFEDATRRLASPPAGQPKGHIAIVLDKKIESAPVVESAIRDDGVIHGSFSEKEAKDLAVVLQTGSLHYPIGSRDDSGKFINGRPEHEVLVGPTLGQDALQRGMFAVVGSLALIAIFMVVYYRILGVVAVVGMVLNILYLMTIMSLLGATLTLPGIGGIALTIGMAVDANILIAERIREEQEKGKTALQAFEHGFNRAFLTIMDANITTLIAAGVLYFMGTGPTRGFAVTLAVGIITTLISVLWACRHVMRSLVQAGFVNQFTMMQFMKTPNYDFIRIAKPAISVSALLVVGSIVLFIVWGTGIFEDKGMDARGIDFKGGTAISMRLEKETPINHVREKVRSVKNESGHPKYEDAEVQIMASVGEGLKDVASFQKTESKFFQVRTSHQVVDEIRVDLLEALKGEMNPEVFLPIDLEKNPPQPSRIFDRTINGGFSIFVKGKDKAIDPAAFAKEIENQAKVYVDKNADGAAYVMVRPAESFADWSRFNVYVAATTPNEAKAQIERVEEQVKTAKLESYVFPTSPFISYDKIGPAAAAELRNTTIWALIVSWVLMIIYIWVRFFSAKFGAAAVLALIHDSVISVGAVLVMYLIIPKGLGLSFELSLSTVAAVLTIIGYSINDTIVIFDRIRENLHQMKRATFSEIINASVNQMLGRTLITSATAWISALCLYVATMTSSSGMSGLAFPLLIGFIAGVYSTVYVCGPLLVWWYRGERPILEKS